ncbi:MAG: hypothetical protein JWL80_569 [Parcubacteria group bacterium]|nr:hypothetical protein [Parcubacteria group bacterium]
MFLTHVSRILKLDDFKYFDRSAKEEINFRDIIYSVLSGQSKTETFLKSTILVIHSSEISF